MPFPLHVIYFILKVNDELTENGGDISPVTWLANYYLTNLVIACKVQCNVC